MTDYWQMSAGGPEQWDGTLHEMFEIVRQEHAKPDGWRGLTISHYSDSWSPDHPYLTD